MSDRIRRAEALFFASLDRPPAERADFVAAADESPDLREEVLRLLARDAESQSALDAALDAAVGAAGVPPPRERIGAYRILRELGAGGMGTVFLAERSIGDARQRVALKLIRGFPTTDARVRLARERTLLAGLDHPNIARLLDGGTTEDGQPYLVMDYVDGEPLLEHCARHALAIDARLQLFTRLCRAVQHAHQRLIVHRDIKPANVLVRADGEPVLLDFGIGKLLDAAPSEATAARVFTPAYAAPEQRRGEAATTASDVYGLGCVLFELLGGRRNDAAADDARVPRPSTTTGEPAFARNLRGELDQIVLKATHELPERRYASADALAADIARYRAGQPIAAIPDSVFYRARKYVRRHRFGAVAALLVIAMSAAFVWRLAVERRHALEQAGRAEATRDFLLSMFNAAAPENTLGKSFSAREFIELGRSRVESNLPTQPELRAQLLATLGQLYVSFGDPQSAVALLEQALPLTEAADAALVRADVEEALGRAYHDLDRVEDSSNAYRRSLELRERDAQTTPGLIARSLQQLGRSEHERGRTAAAQPLLLRALDLRERAEPRDALAIAETRRTLALVHLDLGEVAAARREAEQVETEVRAALPANHPGLLEPLTARASILNRQGDFETARTKLEEALVIARATIGENSTITANLENLLAESLLGLGRFRDSLAHSEAAYRIQRAVRADDPAAGAIAQADLGTAYSTIGDYAHAEALLGDAVGELGKVRPPDDPEMLRARSNLARVQSLAGEHETALAALADVLERTRVLRGEKSERYGFEMLRLATALVRAGRFTEAEQWVDRAEPMFNAVFPEHHPWRADLNIQRGKIALGRGDAARAAREFAAALNLLESQPGFGYDMRLIAAVGDAEAQQRLGHLEEARARVIALKPVLEAELLPTAAERRRLEQVELRLAEVPLSDR
jgi:serine/threonine-protein kinase